MLRLLPFILLASCAPDCCEDARKQKERADKAEAQLTTLQSAVIGDSDIETPTKKPIP
jgi:hypothetical protein